MLQTRTQNINLLNNLFYQIIFAQYYSLFLFLICFCKQIAAVIWFCFAKWVFTLSFFFLSAGIWCCFAALARLGPHASHASLALSFAQICCLLVRRQSLLQTIRFAYLDTPACLTDCLSSGSARPTSWPRVAFEGICQSIWLTKYLNWCILNRYIYLLARKGLGQAASSLSLFSQRKD